MKIFDAKLLISASDLANHLACRHVTTLDLQVVRGEIKLEYREDPRIEALIERGKRHEAAYLSHLESSGLNVLKDDGWLQRTIDAMKKGVDVIAQAYLSDGRWHGRADVLLKVKQASKLGDWSYEVVDTKLARETKGGTILQLCLYSELVETIQGLLPERMHIITPEFFRSRQDAGGTNTYRTLDYLAYHRFVKSRLEESINTMPETYPEPVEHCDICSWWPHCNEQRRQDDHLSFVAGISKLQMRELDKLEIRTLASLVETPFPKEPECGSIESYDKIRHQARLQHQYRKSKSPIHELLDLEPERGLARLPEPSPGDLFFDFESDPFVEEGGIEYLLGYIDLEGNYTALWGLDRLNEKQTFERFIDLVRGRWERFPKLHLYHFTQYDRSALKRLAGRYATREDELDRMLRAEVFVDLHRVLKQTLRASVERYSLKDLEIFFGFKRKTDLRDASKNLRALECALELNDVESVTPKILEVVKNYNYEDCVATLELRNWLEKIRSELIDGGNEIQRPPEKSGDPSDEIKKRSAEVDNLMHRLLKDIPLEQRSAEQNAAWLIAHMLEWHRRELKTTWWEYYRLRELSDEELLDERCAVSGLEFVGRIKKGRCPIDRYRFPLQETKVSKGDTLKVGAKTFGTVDSIDRVARTIEVKKTGAMADIHPTSTFVFDFIDCDQQADSLFRIGEWIADHGINAEGPYWAARDLLLRNRTFDRVNPDVSAEANRLVLQLDHTVLPIQGPPGAGKTYTGAHMICELVRNRKKVGITAMSHKVIRKLLKDTIKAAKDQNLQMRFMQKVGDDPLEDVPEIIEANDNEEPLDALRNNEVQVVGGTAWLWSRKDYAKVVDVLFVDEAGQMSLADVLAVSQAAKSVVLLGDPRQLDQPLQGTHPPGVAVSALQHILNKNETMPPERGLFLDHTWRLPPSICKFTSELFYEGKLRPRDELVKQRLEGSSRFAGSGLFFVPVEHEGNQSSSDEEASVIVEIVRELTTSGMSWINLEGESKSLTLDDILIVAPYNAQVFELSERIRSDRIGTVDKFQGQEAPVVIYSMTTSSPEDAPRGMEFLYSLNRFNVATSRARCVCILVANQKLFEPECKTPRQMKLANALCRYRQMAREGSSIHVDGSVLVSDSTGQSASFR